MAIFIADEMQKNFDKIRANAGAVENQLTSTIANRSQTSVNLSMTKSTIEDLDFANETEVLQRMQILMQSGIFAMQQSNVTADSILSLLQ